MSYVLRPISTIRRVKGDRILGYDDAADIYSVMQWTDSKWTTIPGGWDFRPTHWYELPVTRQSKRATPPESE